LIVGLTYSPNLLALQYVPAISFPQLISPSSLPSTRLLIDPTLPPSLAPHTDPTGTTTAFFSNCSIRNAQQQRLLPLPPPVHVLPVLSPAASSIAHRNESDACPTSSILEQVEALVPYGLLTNRHIPEPFINRQASSSQPQRLPFCPPQSTLLNPSPVNYDEAHADHGVTPPIEDGDRDSFANVLANNLNAAFAGAPAGSDEPQQNANPLLLASHSGVLAPHLEILDFELDNNSPADGRLVSESRMDSSSDSDSSSNDADELQQNANPLLLASHSGALAPHLDFDLDNNSPADGRLISESRMDGSSDSDTSSNDTDSDHDNESPSKKRIQKGLSPGKLPGTQPRPPSPPKTSTQLNGDNVSWKKTTQSSGAGGPNASTKRRRSASPVSKKTLGSEENPIDVDKISSLFEPVATREYVWAFIP